MKRAISMKRKRDTRGAVSSPTIMELHNRLQGLEDMRRSHDDSLGVAWILMYGLLHHIMRLQQIVMLAMKPAAFASAWRTVALKDIKELAKKLQDVRDSNRGGDKFWDILYQDDLRKTIEAQVCLKGMSNAQIQRLLDEDLEWVMDDIHHDQCPQPNKGLKGDVPTYLNALPGMGKVLWRMLISDIEDEDMDAKWWQRLRSSSVKQADEIPDA